MGDEEAATLDGQFYEFARFMETKENKRDGLTITLWRQDYWMRQAKVLEDRKITMTDTGICFFKYNKTEINFDEWHEFLLDVCALRDIDQEYIENAMTNCGIPGTSPVQIPLYREFFDTYKPKDQMQID